MRTLSARYVRHATVSLELSGADCLCCRSAAVGSTIQLTWSKLAHVPKDRQAGKENFTNQHSHRRALSEQCT